MLQIIGATLFIAIILILIFIKLYNFIHDDVWDLIDFNLTEEDFDYKHPSGEEIEAEYISQQQVSNK